MARGGHVRRIESVLESTSQIVDPVIAASWRRCLGHGIDPGDRRRHAIFEHPTVREKRERIGALFTVARHEMKALHRQIAQSGYTILLSDADGLVLERVADAALDPLLDQAGLLPGAHWGEGYEGTNGIGTCISERRSVTVHRAEHFRFEHASLTCSAAPIRDVDGSVLAILDASTVNAKEGPDIQSHTRALVDLSARVIENGHFRRRFQDHWLLRFHPRAELIGFTQEGILALDDAGIIRGCNESALAYLGRESRLGIVGAALETLFHCTLDQLVEHASQGALIRPFELRPGGDAVVFHGYLAMSARPIKQINKAQTRTGKPSRQAGPPPHPTLSQIAGHDPAMKRNIAQARKIADLDIPVMLLGETGTGKEVFARALHAEGHRAARPFVAVNCAALPENLLESELFGYAPGAFTGAARKGFKGRILEAHGGTLFLDEIGDMPLAAQSRLLRVLEERRVTPLGREGALEVDLRVICATHQDLRRKSEANEFRTDLYYRLNGICLTLPALRERTDRPWLLDRLLAAEAEQGMTPVLTEGARKALIDHDWPGNIREMRNAVRMAAALCEENRIQLDDLPQEITRPAQSLAGPDDIKGPNQLHEAERQALIDILDRNHWHMINTAKALGISRNTLYRKMKRHGLSRNAGR